MVFLKHRVVKHKKRVVYVHKEMVMNERTFIYKNEAVSLLLVEGGGPAAAPNMGVFWVENMFWATPPPIPGALFTGTAFFKMLSGIIMPLEPCCGGPW